MLLLLGPMSNNDLLSYLSHFSGNDTCTEGTNATLRQMLSQKKLTAASTEYSVCNVKPRCYQTTVIL